MPIELLNHQIPQVITWFNNFVGFREMYSRLEKVEAKLRLIDFASPTLNKRYFFHVHYKRIILRNRLCQKIRLEDNENYQPISFAAAVQDAARNLSEKGRARLKSQILDALNPDRDFRAIEHELRVYTHYRQQGCKVTFADLEGLGNHDFNVTNEDFEFEVEAKTLNEDIGNLVSTEESLVFFDAYKRAIENVPSFRESGYLTYQLRSRPKNSYVLSTIAEHISDFLRRAPTESQYGDATLTFKRRDDWNSLIQKRQFEPIRREIFSQHETENPHAMVVLGHGQAVMFCVKGNRPLRLFRGIRERLKHASSQLSGDLPGVIWMHFLGLDEGGFESLRSEAIAGKNNAFTSFGRYVFGSENRNHVCRLRLSGEAAAVTANKEPFLIGMGKMITQSGPAYDMTSNVSKFNAQSLI